jgi:hypothetical protein
MFLKANSPLVRVLMHSRDVNKAVPLKHLSPHGLNQFPAREMEDAGLLNIWHDKQYGHVVNLTAKGYRHFERLRSMGAS